MAYLCAENGNLMAIAQQLVQQQQSSHHHHHQAQQIFSASTTPAMAGAAAAAAANMMLPWPPVPAWASADAAMIGDLCSTTSGSSSYLAEPSSVLDLSRAPLFFNNGGFVEPPHDNGGGAAAVVGGGAFMGFGFEDSSSLRNEFMAADWMECLISSSEVLPTVPACESTESSEIPNSSWQGDLNLNNFLGEGFREQILGDESSELKSMAAQVQKWCQGDPQNQIEEQKNPLPSLEPEEKNPQTQKQQQQQPQPPPVEPELKKNHHGQSQGQNQNQSQKQKQESNNGGDLLQSLVECARLVEKDPEAAAMAVVSLQREVCAYGEPVQRLAFYFLEALGRRVCKEKKEKSRVLEEEQQQQLQHSKCLEQFAMAYKALNDACPYAKFAHLTANQAILEATDTADKIHIIDFGIVQGVQWAAILQALATRPSGKPRKVKITGIPAPSLVSSLSQSLQATGKRLTDFAKLLELDFEFCALPRTIKEFGESPVAADSSSVFKIEQDECIAVNFMLQLYNLLGENNESLIRVLQLARSLNPRVVTLGEYEANLNNCAFFPRFKNSLKYYSAFFESMEPNMTRDCAERANIEKLFFAEKICGVVAYEGKERKVRLEGREQWRQIMQAAGFKCSSLSPYAMSQARILLWNYCEGYTLDMLKSDFLSLAWKDRPLLTVSAWSCC